MKSGAYILGFFVGLALAGVLLFLFRRHVKKKFGKSAYDERQKAVRGECYKAAFWVLTGYLCVNGIFCTLTGIEWADPFIMSMIGFILAVTVFIILCIRRDAYFTMNERPKFYIRLFIIILFVEAAVIAWNISTGGSFITDGQLNTLALSAAVSVMIIAVLAALGFRKHCEEFDE